MRIMNIIWRKINLFKFNPPYDYVQNISEQTIHRYLGLEKGDIKKWVIVGGYLGHEVPRILKNYPNCEVVIFECSNRYTQALEKRFSKNPRVIVMNKAVSDTEGTVSFYETNLNGSGSLLKVGELSEKSYDMINQEQFSVNTVTLDSVFQNSVIDVLQIDVQGAELKVLKGAQQALERTKSVFSEISVNHGLYQGSVRLRELNDQLEMSGFHLALLGTDTNLTGNALFLKASKIEK